MATLERIPPWGWVAGAAFLGVVVLAWHEYVNDDDDVDWTAAKESQPPIQLGLLPAPACSGSNTSPIGFSAALRFRGWPASLAADHDSIIGEC